MKQKIVIGAITVGHAAITLLLLIYAFNLGMEQFETGEMTSNVFAEIAHRIGMNFFVAASCTIGEMGPVGFSNISETSRVYFPAIEQPYMGLGYHIPLESASQKKRESMNNAHNMYDLLCNSNFIKYA